ncbi:MAG: hypothetical protein RI953_1311 [Pseudomonadota bacterium]
MVMLNPVCEKLTSLRLHGMLHAFQEQLHSSSYDELSFEDRVAVLVEREIIERENKALSSRLGRAKLRQEGDLEDIRPSAARGLDKSTIKMLSQCEWIRSKRNLLITGPSGSGKTFIASAIARKACLMGMSARYFRATALAYELDNARTEGRLHRSIRAMAKYQLIVIDDFCLSAMSEAEEKDLFELIEDRHGNGTVILTSQNPVNLWHGLMPNPAIADAILDRVVHGAVRLELKGESLRKTSSNLDHAQPMEQ